LLHHSFSWVGDGLVILPFHAFKGGLCRGGGDDDDDDDVSILGLSGLISLMMQLSL
jgi:hypothetical protein